MFKILTTSMLILSIQAESPAEAIQQVKESGYTIVRFM